MSRADEHPAFQGRLVLSFQGHSSFSSEKGDPLFALSSQIGTQLKEELFLPVAITLLTKGMLNPLFSHCQMVCVPKQGKAASMNILLFALELLALLLLCWQKVKENPPCSFALHYFIFSANSESIKTKLAHLRLSVQ